MKIQSIKISNILSFKHFDDIADAPEIKFDKKLSILIGHNGSGKSTVLEVIHFIFGNVLFADPNPPQLGHKNTPSQKNVLVAKNIQPSNFRLQKNWDFPEKLQKIRLELELDKRDGTNIKNLKDQFQEFKTALEKYSSFTIPDYTLFNFKKTTFNLDIEFDNVNGVKVNQQPLQYYYGTAIADLLLDYILKVNFYSIALEIDSEVNSRKKIKRIHNTFGFIGAFRNYGSTGNSFNIPSGSTVDSHQKNYRTSQYAKSTHLVETNEPAIFNYMRGVLAYAHSNLQINEGRHRADIKIQTNSYIKQINKHLEIIGLKITITRTDDHTPNYQFSFVKTNRTNSQFDFNALSAGQRSFLHIIFEVIGNNIENGCIVIDEPELHLHNQLQQEYLNLVTELAEITSGQFIMVTHSDVFINEKTLNNVVRFALEKEDETEYSKVFIRGTNPDRKSDLIKLLDNKRSGNIFFSKKVVLVEGETDRYFFQSIFDLQYPELKQDITVMNIDGKTKYKKWKSFLDSFGIQNYFICDFDNVQDFGVINKKEYKSIIEKCKKEIFKKINEDCLKHENCRDATYLLNQFETIINKNTLTLKKQEKEDLVCFFVYLLSKRLPSGVINKYVNSNKSLKQGIDAGITSKYQENVFILKNGSLEAYTEQPKSLENVVNFCNTNLESFMKNKRDQRSIELNEIVEQIINT